MFAAWPEPGLDDVGVERALDQEPRRVAARAEFARDRLELADEQLADDLALAPRGRDARERVEEPVLGLHVDQLDAELVA